MIRLLKWGFALLVALFLFAVGAVGVLIWLTLPGGDASANLGGLSGAATATIDADGIARIQAANETDAAAVLGYLHARERLFQMDVMRRAASGELSEVFGEATLANDRYVRTLGLRRRAEIDYSALPEPVRAMLDAYARGVNAWITRRGRLASPEIAVLGWVRRWSPVDSLLWGKTMALYLSGNERQERARLLLAGKLSRQDVLALWPDANGARRPEAALDPARLGDPSVARVVTRLAELIPAFPAPFTQPPTASNAWAVDGAHSETGAPLLAGDPHLAFGFPSIWYLARIETPDGVLVGATAPGVPFMVLGHNGHVAWTFTTTGADVQDLFVETPAGDGQYQTPYGAKPYDVRQEHIRVRGEPDEVLTVRETRHGPVVSDLAGATGPVLALEAANLAYGDTSAAGLLALNHARNVTEAGQAASQISTPVQNLTVADHAGIALFVTGRVPIRKAGDGSYPVPGADGSHDWLGWASGADLPHVVAPASGHVVNANEAVAPADFPVFLGRDWYDEYRALRIRALLGGAGKHSVASFTAMQADILSVPARALLPSLLAAAKAAKTGADARTREALALLSGWDGAVTRDRPQPLIFNAWMQRLYMSLLDRIGVPEAAQSAVAPWPQFLHAVLEPSGAHWCGGDCAPVIIASLTESLDELARRFGDDPGAWRWGAAHQAVFTSPLWRTIPWLGDYLAARIESPGDGTTIDRGGVALGDFDSVHGPEFRAVYDLADLERSRFVIAPGQSGNPFSSLAHNFLQRWRDGATIQIPGRPDHVTETLSFRPPPRQDTP